MDCIRSGYGSVLAFYYCLEIGLTPVVEAESVIRLFPRQPERFPFAIATGQGKLAHL